MQHFGDITKLSGYTLPVVDVITGGSPCQDLSVAGKRAGLDGERSGLFMEQIRIVKEMRERDKANGRTGYLIRPRYMVWENVPGAFSSNKGEDFQAVLTEIVRIVDTECPDVPLPEKGKWSKSGCLRDDMGRWSVAWRVHDAQFWGVAQRRKRLSVIVDFGGLSAPEILFERKGMRWYPDESSKKGEETPRGTGEGSDEASGVTISFQERAGCPGGGKGILIQEEHVGALSTLTNQRVLGFNRERVGAVVMEDMQPTIQAAAGESGNNQPNVCICEAVAYNGENITSPTNKANPKPGDPCHTLGTDERNYCVTYCLEGNGSRDSHKGDGYRESETMYTLNTVEQHAVAYGISSYDSNAMKSSNPHSGIYEADTSRTLDLNGGSPACNQGGIAIVQVLNDQGGGVMNVTENVTATLRSEEHGHQPLVFDGSRRHGYEQFDEVCETVQAQYGTGGNNTPIVVEPTMIEMTSTKNTIIEDGTCPTLTARMGTGGNQVNAVCMDVGFFQAEEEKAGALLARQYKDPPITYQNKTGALMASGYNKLGTQEAANDMYVTGSVVRRLTPLECERLQGFPDGWTDIGEWVDSKGKKHKDADSPRYKALGNSIAIPFWFYLLRRIAAQYERPATLGSLFDGIGGFPLCWERCNGPGTAIWASEIEEFPIAVTKKRFP